MHRTIIHFAFLAVITLSEPIFPMAMDGHVYGDVQTGYPGIVDLRGTPPHRGGVGDMSPNKAEVVSRWMDNPATKTGEYINHKAGGITVHPTNHNALRHNPDKVGQALSGTGTTDSAVKNAARMHKIGDVAHNKMPIDGWEITPELRKEAKEILDYVRKYGALPKKLPPWVDAQGPLIRYMSANLDGTAEALAGSSARSAGLSAARGAGRIMGGTIAIAGGVALTGLMIGDEMTDNRRDYEHGATSAGECGVRNVQAVTGPTGGLAGVVAGAACGSLAGPPGLIIGGIIGGLAGDFSTRGVVRLVAQPIAAAAEAEQARVRVGATAFSERAGPLALSPMEYQVPGLSRTNREAILSAGASPVFP